MRSLVPILWMVLALPALPASAQECGALKEAKRQVDFARQEVAEGECERALKSAESALRLCPDHHDAYLFKAQAYECAGDYPQARITLEALLEIGPGDAGATAKSELERLSRIEDPGSPDVLRVQLDPEPFQERVAAALDAGHCAAASAAAEELRRAQPELAEGWRLLGKGLSCAGREREAVHALDEYARLGGADADVLRLRDQLRSGLGVLDVRLADHYEDVITRFRLAIDGVWIEPTTSAQHEAKFTDVPPGRELTLSVVGRGLNPVREELGALGAGERRSKAVETEYIGLGTIEASDFDPNAVGAVFIEGGGERVELLPGASVRVTAGVLEVQVGPTPSAAARIPLEIRPKESVTFDPTPYRPTRLTLGLVPAGSKVSVGVAGDDGVATFRLVELPLQVGSIDPGTGLRLAEPALLEKLIGGRADLALQHPVLGLWQRSTVLEVGESNGFEVDSSEFSKVENLAAIQKAWELWQAEKAEAERGHRRKAVAFGVLGGTLLAGGAVALAAGAGQTKNHAALALYCEVLEERGADGAEAACTERAKARSAQLGLVAGGGLGVLLGTGGVVLSGVFGGKAQRALPRSGAWDPWAVVMDEEAER